MCLCVRYSSACVGTHTHVSPAPTLPTPWQYPSPVPPKDGLYAADVGPRPGVRGCVIGGGAGWSGGMPWLQVGVGSGWWVEAERGAGMMGTLAA